MASVEVKKQGGRTVGLIIIVVGLLITTILTFVILRREGAKEIPNVELTDKTPHHWSSLNWIPAIGVVIAGVGIALFWKSSRD